MADHPDLQIESYCPAGGDTEVTNTMLEPGGWKVTCSIHGTLGWAPSMADTTPVLQHHRRSQGPTGTPRA